MLQPDPLEELARDNERPKAKKSKSAASRKYSDEELARSFAIRHGADLRYVNSWGKWLQWDGARWLPVHTMLVYGHARAVCRDQAEDCPSAKQANNIASAKTVSAVVRMASYDPDIDADADRWDRDPMTLACPGLSVNLQTGDEYPPSRDDYATKNCAVAPNPETPIPLWDGFLDRVTGGNVALQLYLQRMAGYFLTGQTREQALFFLYGTGANGKSVFVETLRGVMADYGTGAPMETFVETRNDQHPTELAMLRGARLVTATETQSGRRWNEARIKALTGGDLITARFMRQDYFEFRPSFKLLISGNHKPSLGTIDEAIRRRIHLVPFTITIPPAERDQGLSAKLQTEWPGILQWAIEGCSAWLVQGLAPPAAVVDATRDYLASEDVFKTWIEECCTTGANDYATGADLFKSWREWCERGNEKAGGRKGFSQRMMDAKYTPKRQSGTGKTGFEGIAVKSGQASL